MGDQKKSKLKGKERSGVKADINRNVTPRVKLPKPKKAKRDKHHTYPEYD